MPGHIRIRHRIVPCLYRAHGSTPNGVGTFRRLSLDQAMHLCAPTMVARPLKRVRERPVRLLPMPITAVIFRT